MDARCDVEPTDQHYIAKFETAVKTNAHHDVEYLHCTLYRTSTLNYICLWLMDAANSTCLQYLLQHINSRWNGELMYAAIGFQCRDVVAALLDHGFDVCRQELYLMRALKIMNVDIVECLLQHGAPLIQNDENNGMIAVMHVEPRETRQLLMAVLLRYHPHHIQKSIYILQKKYNVNFRCRSLQILQRYSRLMDMVEQKWTPMLHRVFSPPCIHASLFCILLCLERRMPEKSYSHVWEHHIFTYFKCKDFIHTTADMVKIIE